MCSVCRCAYLQQMLAHCFEHLLHLTGQLTRGGHAEGEENRIMLLLLLIYGY